MYGLLPRERVLRGARPIPDIRCLLVVGTDLSDGDESRREVERVFSLFERSLGVDANILENGLIRCECRLGEWSQDLGTEADPLVLWYYRGGIIDDVE